MWRIMLSVVVVGLAAAGCGGGGDAAVTRADLIDWLQEQSGQERPIAECTADRMLDEGLTQAELREFLDLDADMSEDEYREREPSRIDTYTDAAVDCVFADVGASVGD